MLVQVAAECSPIAGVDSKLQTMGLVSGLLRIDVDTVRAAIANRRPQTMQAVKRNRDARRGRGRDAPPRAATPARVRQSEERVAQEASSTTSPSTADNVMATLEPTLQGWQQQLRKQADTSADLPSAVQVPAPPAKPRTAGTLRHARLVLGPSSPQGHNFNGH